MTVGAFRVSVNRIERLYSSHSGDIFYHHYHCHYYHNYHYYHCTTMSAICTHISLIDQDAACSFSESIFVKSIARLCLDRQVCAAHGHQISPAHITILRIDKTHTISSNLCLATFSFCFLFFNLFAVLRFGHRPNQSYSARQFCNQK